MWTLYISHVIFIYFALHVHSGLILRGPMLHLSAIPTLPQWYVNIVAFHRLDFLFEAVCVLSINGISSMAFIDAHPSIWLRGWDFIPWNSTKRHSTQQRAINGVMSLGLQHYVSPMRTLRRQAWLRVHEKDCINGTSWIGSHVWESIDKWINGPRSKLLNEDVNHSIHQPMQLSTNE